MKNYKSNEPCVACGVSGDGITCWHHELSRGAAIEHSENKNVMFTLCTRCHGQRHAVGQSAFIGKFPHYAKALEAKGWVYDELRLKWIFPQSE